MISYSGKVSREGGLFQKSAEAGTCGSLAGAGRPVFVADIQERKDTMEYLLTAEEMALADRNTSEKIGIPPLVLMERAALAVAEAVREDFPLAAKERAAASPEGKDKDTSSEGPVRVAVIAGKGNNGADAIAAGRILLDFGYDAAFFAPGRKADSETLQGKAHPDAEASEGTGTGPERGKSLDKEKPWEPSSMEIQCRILHAYGKSLQPLQEGGCLLGQFHPDVVIDGLFGTGLSRKVTGEAADAIGIIQKLRSRGAKVYAVDIPSGVFASTGEILGTAVEADVTVTFSFYKRGQFLYPGCELCGRVVRREIGITKRAFAENAPEHSAGNKKELFANSFPEVFTYLQEDPMSLLPKRRQDGNKGTFGKVLVIAGSRGVSGACTMCAGAALRMGAGMVRVFTHEDNRVILQTTLPEAMCSTYPSAREKAPGEEERKAVQKDLLACLQWADVAAIGPGMGKSKECRELLAFVLRNAAEYLRGLVIDADAIRLLAERDGLYEELRKTGRSLPVILTPHPAECAALFQKSVSEVQRNRFAWLPAFAEEFSCTIIGKDARTLVASAGCREQYLNVSGNDGLATAGSGDVLTGITAACLAFGMDPFPAASAAAYLHGRLADALAKEENPRAIVATDLLRKLQEM